MSIIQKAATSLDAAARSLLLQHKYSNGYISVGDSEIGEANLVLHAAASLLRRGSCMGRISVQNSREQPV
jgi:hypothetical protein